jgi:hypothetical protein
LRETQPRCCLPVLARGMAKTKTRAHAAYYRRYGGGRASLFSAR